MYKCNRQLWVLLENFYFSATWLIFTKFKENIKEEWNFYLVPLMIIVSITEGVLSKSKLEIIDVSINVTYLY